MGILEALGVMGGAEPAGPAAWILGKEMLPSAAFPGGYVDESSVRDVASFLAPITDAQFAEMANGNVLDTDVEYLSHYFAKLRAFYQAAAAGGAAVITNPPG